MRFTGKNKCVQVGHKDATLCSVYDIIVRGAWVWDLSVTPYCKKSSFVIKSLSERIEKSSLFQTATYETMFISYRKTKSMSINSICANLRIFLRIFRWDSYGQTQLNLLKYPKAA